MALLDLLTTANSYTDGLFGTMLVFSLYCVIFISVMLNQREFHPAAISAGIITAISSIFLRIAGIVTDQVFFYVIAACAIPMGIALFIKKS